jgi:anti-anti-sigma factor
LNLVLDLQELDYISSAGLRSIFRARKALGMRDGRVLVVNPQPQVQKVFDIVKAVPVREIFRSVEELDSYLDRIQARALDPDLE